MILLFFFQLFFRSKKDFCATVIKVHLDSRSSENEDDFWQNEEEFSREEEEGDEGDEEDEEDEEEEEEEEEETTTTTVVFVRSSVCLRFNNCYFELLSSVFWILLFFSRRERRIVSICPTKIETMREREREKCFPLLFTYRFSLSHRFCCRDLHRCSVVSFLVASSARFCKRCTKSDDDKFNDDGHFFEFLFFFFVICLGFLTPKKKTSEKERVIQQTHNTTFSCVSLF